MAARSLELAAYEDRSSHPAVNSESSARACFNNSMASGKRPDWLSTAACDHTSQDSPEPPTSAEDAPSASYFNFDKTGRGSRTCAEVP